MFYSVNLLSLRRKGKFAKCWLAANLDTKAFRNKFRGPTIIAINISTTCEELITHTLGHNDPRQRFSLYLSSKLMCGATKILHYQTILCLKQEWELWIRNNGPILDPESTGKRKKNVMSIPANEFLLPPVQPRVNHTVRHFVASEDSITIREDFYGGAALRQAHDWLSFGALTGEEMDLLLQPDEFCLGPLQSSRVRGFSEEIISSSVPLADIEVDKPPHDLTDPIPLVPQGEHQNGIQASEGALLPILPDTLEEPGITQPFPIHAKWPATPTKRKPSNITNGGTPSKMRRVNDVGELPVPIPNAESVTEHTVDTSSNALELDSVNTSNQDKRRQRRRRKNILIIDENTQLSQAGILRQTENIVIQCRQKDIIKHPTISAQVLLENPLTQPAWGKSLLINYQMMIIKLKSEDAVETATKRRKPQRSLPGPSIKEVVRGSPDTIMPDRSELSSNIGKSTTSIKDITKGDISKTWENIPIIEEPAVIGLQDVIPRSSVELFPKSPDFLHEPTSAAPDLPEIIKDILSDWPENGRARTFKTPAAVLPCPKLSSTADVSGETSTKTQMKLKRQYSTGSQQTSTSRSSLRSESFWARGDMLGNLEVLWQEKEFIEFRDICPPSTNTKSDAARTFIKLLALHKSKDCKLMQANSYNPIYINRYTPY